jgi:hypothetical protein
VEQDLVKLRAHKSTDFSFGGAPEFVEQA